MGCADHRYGLASRLGGRPGALETLGPLAGVVAEVAAVSRRMNGEAPVQAPAEPDAL